VCLRATDVAASAYQQNTCKINYCQWISENFLTILSKLHIHLLLPIYSRSIESYFFLCRNSCCIYRRLRRMAASAGKFCSHAEAVCFFRIAGSISTAISYLVAAGILYLSCYLFKMTWSSYLADMLGYIVVLPRTAMDAAESTEYLLVALYVGILKIYCSNFRNLYSTDCPASETSRLRGRSVPPFCNYCKNWVFKIFCIQIEF